MATGSMNAKSKMSLVVQLKIAQVAMVRGSPSGRLAGGRFLHVVYVPDRQPGSVFVITAYELGPNALRALRRRRQKKA